MAQRRYRTALCITGLVTLDEGRTVITPRPALMSLPMTVENDRAALVQVTLIAFYHYYRIFNSWTESYMVRPEPSRSPTNMFYAMLKIFDFSIQAP